jgi:uncharacterized membrane protein YidH (DUF202 family)
MAKAIKKVSTPSVEWKLPFEKQNFMILLIGLGIILLGYALMATGITETAATVDGTWNNPLAVYVAPTLLIIGYCVVIPYGIIRFFGKKEVNAG